jgi:hypothetical protein
MIIVAAVATSMVGCKTTMDDRWRSDLGTTLEEAHFRPVYEVQKEKGIVSGSAEETYSWWGIFGSSPDTYANEIGGPLTLKPGVKEAAFADACKKANCQILLAPRFTVTKETGFLWFCGRNKAIVEGVPAVLKTAEEIPLEKWVEYQSKLAPCKCKPSIANPLGLL